MTQSGLPFEKSSGRSVENGLGGQGCSKSRWRETNRRLLLYSRGSWWYLGFRDVVIGNEIKKQNILRDIYKVKPILHGNTYYVGGEGEGDY